MATIKQKISPCLWFDTQAEAAANFYVSVFPNSRINQISRYTPRPATRCTARRRVRS